MKERATLLELIAIITIFISFLFYFFLFSNPIIVMIRRSISNIGQLILIINYIINKDYIFRLTFPVHDIYIINSSGILVYHQHVSTRNLPDIDETEQLVISGAIQAISMVISQTLGSKAKLKLFDADEYKIHFSELKNESGIVAIVSSGNNYYLQKSLERFSNMISEDILENINSVVVNNQHIYQLLNNNLKKCFPYLILVEKNIDILNESKN